jgi:hypothetical protein
MVTVLSGNGITGSRIMASLEQPAQPANFSASSAPYRLPSRHPSAGAGDSVPGDGHARVAAIPSEPHISSTNNASDIKRRQEALLIAYLVSRRLAR